MKCKKCKKEIPDNSNFCNMCGAPQKEGKMYRRSDGLYEKNKTIDGKRVYFRGKTEKEVYDKMVAYHAEQDSGPLFKDVAEEWYADILERLSPNSLKNYVPAYKRVLEDFGKQRIITISTHDIKAFYAKLVKKKFARKTIATHQNVLNGVFKLAQEQYNYTHNPVAVVPLPSNLTQNKRLPPSEEDLKRVLSNVAIPFGLFAYMAMHTGMRLGELLALEYQDIDYENKQITVSKSLYWEGNTPHIKPPKTKAGVRTIPLLQALESHMPKGEGYVFNSDGGLLTKSRYEKLWDEYKKAAGISSSPHQFRHGFATTVFEAGVSIKDAQTLLGHAQYATTADTYTHVNSNRIKDAASKLDAYLTQKYNKG